MEKKPEPKGKAIKFGSIDNTTVGHQVNTFRVGDDWPKRVKAGDTVKLIAAADNADLGEGEVTSVYGGKWDSVKALAVDNHMFANSPNPVSGLGAQEILKGELKRLYPDANIDTAEITVVYFTRTK